MPPVPGAVVFNIGELLSSDSSKSPRPAVFLPMGGHRPAHTPPEDCTSSPHECWGRGADPASTYGRRTYCRTVSGGVTPTSSATLPIAGQAASHVLINDLVACASYPGSASWRGLLARHGERRP